MTKPDRRHSSGTSPSKSKRQLEKEDPSKLPSPNRQGSLRVEAVSSSQQTSLKAPASLNSSGRHLSHQHLQHNQKDPEMKPPMRNSFVQDDSQLCSSEPGISVKIAPEPLRADKSSPPGGEDLLKVSNRGPSPRFMSEDHFTSNRRDEVSRFNPNQEMEKTGCFGRYMAASPKSTRPSAYMNPGEVEDWAKQINKEEAAAIKLQKLTGNFVSNEAESNSTLIASKPTPPPKEVPGLLSGAEWIKLRDELARKRRRRRTLQIAGGLLTLLCLVTIFLIMLFVNELNFINFGPTSDDEDHDAKIKSEFVSEVIHSPPPATLPPLPPISPDPPPPPVPSPPPCPPMPPIRPSPPPSAPWPPPAEPPIRPPPAPQMPTCIQKDWSLVFPIPFQRWPDGYTYADQLGARGRRNRHHHRGLLQTDEIANATNFSSSPPPGPSPPPPSPSPPPFPPPGPSPPPPSPPPSPPSPPTITPRHPRHGHLYPQIRPRHRLLHHLEFPYRLTRPWWHLVRRARAHLILHEVHINSGWMGDWFIVEKDVEKLDAVVE
ncbi:hypothetical protein CYMTET_6628, partial [Cymbomonas tetramitiformis]